MGTIWAEGVGRSLDEAVELSRGCPVFEHDGSVEVRQIRQM